MIRIVIAALLVGSSFGVALASVTNKFTVEGMTIGFASILLIFVMLAVVYFINRKPKAGINYS